MTLASAMPFNGVPQRVQVAAHHFRVLLQGHAVHLQLVAEALHLAVDFLRDHAIGDIRRHIGSGLFQHGVFERGLDGIFLFLQKAALDICLELVQRLKFRDILDEFIILLRDNLFLDFLDLHVEHDGLARQLLVIILREGDVEVLLFPGAHADDLLFKAGHEGVGAQLQLIVLALAAVKRDAIVEAFEVDDRDIAILGGALDRRHPGNVLRHPVRALLRSHRRRPWLPPWGSPGPYNRPA